MKKLILSLVFINIIINISLATAINGFWQGYQFSGPPASADLGGCGNNWCFTTIQENASGNYIEHGIDSDGNNKLELSIEEYIIRDFPYEEYIGLSGLCIYQLTEDNDSLTIACNAPGSAAWPFTYDPFEEGNAARIYSMNRVYESSCSMFPILGDINNDSSLNILDLVQISNLILDDDYNECGDTNSDNELNILDLVILVNIILDEGVGDINGLINAVKG